MDMPENCFVVVVGIFKTEAHSAPISIKLPGNTPIKSTNLKWISKSCDIIWHPTINDICGG